MSEQNQTQEKEGRQHFCKVLFRDPIPVVLWRECRARQTLFCLLLLFEKLLLSSFFFFTGNLWPLASKGLFQRTAANCILSLFVPVLPNPYWWCCERTPLDPVNKGRHNHEPFSITLTVLSVTNEVLIRTPGHFDLVFLLHTSPSYHLFGLTVQHRPTVGGRRNQTQMMSKHLYLCLWQMHLSIFTNTHIHLVFTVIQSPANMSIISLTRITVIKANNICFFFVLFFSAGAAALDSYKWRVLFCSVQRI